MKIFYTARFSRFVMFIAFLFLLGRFYVSLHSQPSGSKYLPGYYGNNTEAWSTTERAIGHSNKANRGFFTDTRAT